VDALTTEALQTIRRDRPQKRRADRDRGSRSARPAWRQLGWDAGAVLLASLDLVLVADELPPEVPTYAHALSWFSCAVLVFRRRFPRLVLAVAVPGLLAGYALVAAMIALYTTARTRPLDWQVIAGCAGVWASAFVLWPVSEFLQLSAHQVSARFMYSGLEAIAPFALGTLMRTRTELSQRLRELAEGREREKRLHAHAVLAQERTRLAREMHDVVSHQVTLIAMQAGALQVSTADPDTQEIARNIRALSTRTLDELRQLVGVLRVAALDAEAASQPGLDRLPELISACAVDVELRIGNLPENLPRPVSATAYRTIQEALTNARKHAPGSSARVEVRVEDEQLLVEVHNGPARRPAEISALPSGGHGLCGLRERAELLGGVFSAHPTEDGGYVVRATYRLTDPRHGRGRANPSRP